MATQISFCYASNRASSTPVTPLLVTSFSGRLKDRMDNNTKATYLKWKGMEWWEEGWESLYSPSPSSSEAAEEKISVGHLAGKLKSRADKSSIIYLSGDSPNVLTSLDEGTTYIIGGIVDHNRYKSLCLDKAEAMGIAHAQLPIGEYLPEMLSRKVLTVNQVSSYTPFS
jgi:tRNA (guanine9-N1)-methyltransferase